MIHDWFQDMSSTGSDKYEATVRKISVSKTSIVC